MRQGYLHIKKQASNIFIIISDVLGKMVYMTTLGALKLEKFILTKLSERLLFLKIFKKVLSFNFKILILKLEGFQAYEEILNITNFLKFHCAKHKINFLGINLIENLPHNGCKQKKKKLLKLLKK